MKIVLHTYVFHFFVFLCSRTRFLRAGKFPKECIEALKLFCILSNYRRYASNLHSTCVISPGSFYCCCMEDSGHAVPNRQPSYDSDILRRRIRESYAVCRLRLIHVSAACS